MAARNVLVTVTVPRCANETLSTREITDIKNAILADQIHTLVTPHSTCLLQATDVVVNTNTVQQ